MANPEHLAILKQGVGAWNKWRAESSSTPDLKEANLGFRDLGGYDLRAAGLREANLAHASLHRARLSKANLRGAVLHESNVSRADLVGANLTESDLSVALLYEADLSNANLRKANLWGASLHGTRLRRTRFDEAILSGTGFVDCDLSRAVGLDKIQHEGPSMIDVATLFECYGKIPDIFLRGVGIPEAVLTYTESLIAAGEPIRFHSCFISHSTHDRPFVERLYADLQVNGVRCWFALHDIQGGKKIHEQIDKAIQVYDRLLLVLSEHSMASEWVKTEIANARQREIREKRQMLFPISLMPYEKIKEWKAFDADTGKDSAREIREYFIPDFSNWKDHDSYQQAFQRLLRDLKAEKTDGQ